MEKQSNVAMIYFDPQSDVREIRGMKHMLKFVMNMDYKL